MELDLNRDDLLPEHKDIACSATGFKHFQPIAQAAITLVGEAMFRSRDSYNKIYPPKKKRECEIYGDTKLRLITNNMTPTFPTKQIKEFCLKLDNNANSKGIVSIKTVVNNRAYSLAEAEDLAKKAIAYGMLEVVN